eukprot:Lankesteria_metandrocarpae@DN4107_c0_g2_i1.p2
MDDDEYEHDCDKVVLSCYSSNSKTLESAVTSLTRMCFLNAFETWLDLLGGNPALLRHSKENEERRIERKILLKRQERLKKCLAVLAGIADDTTIADRAF